MFVKLLNGRVGACVTCRRAEIRGDKEAWGLCLEMRGIEKSIGFGRREVKRAGASRVRCSVSFPILPVFWG